jgi:hypothetical protein
MPIRLTDNLAYPNRGTATQALAYAVTQRADRQVFLMEYFTELYRLCAKYQLDAAILVAQSANETDSWRSGIWNQYGNPAGIGVTGSDVSSGTNYSLVYKNGKDAARAHVVHMQAYVRGQITPAAGELYDYIPLDPRYSAVLQADYDKTIRRIQDFNVNGRWALLTQPPPYGTRIVNDGQDVWPGLPDQVDPPVEVPTTPEEPIPMPITFGNVPHPIYQNRIIQNSTAWNDLGKRGGKAVVWHRIYGSLWGTDGYFRGEASGRALTDYGVGVAATDGAANAGVILMWNDPFGRRAPWASGPVNNPIGDGAKFVNLFGVNAVNRDGVSIEISGLNGSTAVDAKARASIVALTAYFADQYGKVLAAKGKQFDWTTFPIIPSEDNRSFVCYHGEFYDGKRYSCPGPVVEAATDGMLAEVKALLKQYQTAATVPDVPTPPVYATPKPPAAGDSIVNERIFLAHAQEYTVKADVTPRIYADPGSDPTGPVIAKGAKVKTTHVVSDAGEDADLTAIIEGGARIPVKGVLV